MKRLKDNLKVSLIHKEEEINFSIEELEINKMETLTTPYLRIELDGEVKRLPYNKIRLKRELLFSVKNYNKKDLLTAVIGNLTIHFFIDNKGDLYITRRINQFLKIRQKNLGLKIRNNIYYFGIISNIKNRIKNSDVVRLNDEIYTTIKRPFKFWKFKHLAYFKIDLNDVLVSEKVHNHIFIGTKDIKGVYLRQIHFRKMRYFRKNNQVIIARKSFNNNNIIFTNLEYFPEYNFINMFKNVFAYFLDKITPKNKSNLYFEKESNRAQESGVHVFKEIIKLQQKNKIKSKNYFILNGNSPEYLKLKNKYGKYVVKKHSFKHYYLIYKSNYFISSELSFHAMNTRLYLPFMTNELKSKKLVFLQHGIMFAKPVDNPMAMAFWKNNSFYNVYKSVVSSDLEATQFYKMGYDDSDLIKCGLPKFDISKRHTNADKIMYMPTYRFWEEINMSDSNKIKETTYYKSFKDVIISFEKAGLLDKLIVSGHPKFSEEIKKSMPQYSNIFVEDINKALSTANIFITDYSSASYDAHYRGAHIIYYWKERDYLIKNYQAVPPINETNCDGYDVYSEKELIETVQKILKPGYKKPKEHIERYKKINEFDDNKNTERLLKELIDLNIV